MKRIRRISRSRPTLEGAGVRLKRAFGYAEVPELDPFLLLDDFHSRDPQDYLRGFPWHPHRGIETITYVLHGRVEHGDSMGTSGIISSGDVQWMTAGSGIIHQEMPIGEPDGLMRGLQLWANLPASHKMMDPRYREVRSREIPVASPAPGVEVRVVCGQVGGVRGPVSDIVIEPEYLDVTLDAHGRLVHPIPAGRTVFAYVIDGEGGFGDGRKVGAGTLILFEDGDEVEATGPMRMLLVSGRPLGEPVAWHGPIVMNTEEELAVAYEELRAGTFIRRGTPQSQDTQRSAEAWTRSRK